MSKKNGPKKAYSRSIELETGSLDAVFVQRGEQPVDRMAIRLGAPHLSIMVWLTLAEAESLKDTLAELLDEALGLNEVTGQRQEKRQRARMNALLRQAGLKPLKKGAAQ